MDRTLDWETLERHVAYTYGRRYTGDLTPDEITADRDDLASAAWLGPILGMDRRNIHGWRQRAVVSVTAAERFADQLGVHPADIWGAAYYAALPTEEPESPRQARQRMERDRRYLEKVRAS